MKRRIRVRTLVEELSEARKLTIRNSLRREKRGGIFYGKRKVCSNPDKYRRSNYTR
jgi:hypothetical protein